MLDVAESARSDAALPARLGVSPSRSSVSVERPGGNSAASNFVSYPSAAYPSSTLEIVAVIERPAPREVGTVVKQHGVIAPVEPPVTPSPSKTTEPANSKADSEGEVRPAKPDSGIRIPR